MDLPVNIYGNGKQVRDILYAQDVVSAFDAFYRHPKPGIYNIGGGKGNMISLLEAIDAISAILDKKINIKFARGRLGDLKYFVCNISKAKNALGWQPEIMPKAGIRKLIEWIKENSNLFK